MKKSLLLVILYFVFFIFYYLPGFVHSQVPQTLSFQGVLKDAGGMTVPNGDYSLTFNLYPVETGGTTLWTEIQTVPVADGIFNVILGSVTPLNADFDVPYWLGVTVGAGSEMPRIRLTSAAYSLNAKSVEDTAITTAKIADEAVTQAKLAPGLSLPPGGAAGGDLTGTYPNPAIAENAVNSAKIQDGSIQLTDLAFTPLSRPLSPGVATAEIADNAVTTPKIEDGAITQAKLSPGLSIPPGGTAGGDLTGTYPNPTIAASAVNSTKIQDGQVGSADVADNAVVTAKINDGAVTQVKIAAGVTLPPSGTAGGDLTSSYPNPTVDGIQGRAVASTAPASGQVLKWSGSNWAPAPDESGGPPSGAAGGDLTGTYPNPTIAGDAVTSAKILDSQVAAADLATSAVTTAKINDLAVSTAKIADGAVTQAKIGTGVTLPPSGTAGGDLSGSYPIPSVDGLQGRGVSSTAPTSGQVLKWSGTSWTPAVDDTGTSVWNVSGTNIYSTNTGNVGIGVTSPGRKLQVEGDIGVGYSGNYVVGAYPGLWWNSSLGSVAIGPTNAVDLSFYSGSATPRMFVNRTNGRVGIGTTVPNSQLQVAGTIESSSGGFRFPDGTLQTSAAPQRQEIYFSVKRDATYNWPINGSVQTIDFSSNSTIWENQGNGFVQSNSTFYAPVAGIYTFHGAVDFTGINAGDLIYTEISAASRVYRGQMQYANGATEEITVSITVHLNASDMVRLRGYVNAATGQASVYGNTAAYGFTYFNGALVY